MSHTILISYAWRCDEKGCWALGIGSASQTEAAAEAASHHALHHQTRLATVTDLEPAAGEENR